MSLKLKKTSRFVSYDEMEDEAIVDLVRDGNNDAMDYLINKYKNYVRAKARTYFLIGADREDIIQEGMIGLYKAIRDYDEEKISSFRAFAELCITRQIITAIKAATRQKHIPLNSYISLHKPIFNDGSEKTTLMDVIIGGKVANPEELLIGQENLEFIEQQMGEILSDLECKVLSLYLQGKAYYEIAEEMNRDIKSIDNALQRVKKKLEKFLNNKKG
ncbi:MAG TPA: RNA polymerase sporulation sigma factor SigH [Defluviitaleaceae bacterium]|nr:RNA polymerase sporulation sigma factor SigH [Candidatus Epulonipiscium sp.]HOQ17486.1 RNA polymerase sporulation sigma factor SigH [Defluviitaleaceae bacterium]HPT76455.1 RNA polymerase sporulation sigma factor SigH [Defluviitaleaceae bacterium]HQD49597.1 RNA polymerase sporulation sigma factor SigH [Defluviitaleaceae bacterium]